MTRREGKVRARNITSMYEHCVSEMLIGDSGNNFIESVRARIYSFRERVFVRSELNNIAEYMYNK